MMKILRKKSFEKIVTKFSEFILRHVRTYLTIFIGKDITDILPLRLRLFHIRILGQDLMLYAVVTLKEQQPDTNYIFRADLGTIKFSGKELRVWVIAKTVEDMVEDLKKLAMKIAERGSDRV